ncbi:MAG: FMN-binding negative transcriptional regulator [Sphingomonadales bacterium]|nr:FMN-binding negative transcriptional regulator [Sphingomonadales bacterium]
MNPIFAPRRAADVSDLIDRCRLGLIVSGTGEGLAATPLPLLAKRGRDGEVTELLGHFARSNPHVAKLEKNPYARALFLGPNAAISPKWVSKPQWGPTWNYAFVDIAVEITFLPDQNDVAVRQLVSAVEGDSWNVEQLGDRYESLIDRIIAFRARVVEQNAVFKLGQDEDRKSFSEILAGLGDDPLAALMRRQAEE